MNAVPRLGVLDFHLIQYHVPLYQRLAARGQVQLDVMYLRDAGYRPAMSTEFGELVEWDIDVLSGYQSQFLNGGQGRAGRLGAARLGAARRLTRWLRAHDAVVIHGHSHPAMLFAVAACRALGVPYLLRGDASAQGQATGLLGRARDQVAHAVVSHSAAGLAAGQLNGEFYAKYEAPRIVFAPYSVDNDRFAGAPAAGSDTERGKLLARWGLPDTAPVIMFCGQLDPRKRPLDLLAAADRLDREVVTLVVGGGVLADQVRAALRPGRGAVTGFVNQGDLPPYYHAADILVLPSSYEPWGLVVNEAMAAGVIPVVSDRVGAAPDLVDGVGEIYPGGDVAALAAALDRALDRLSTPGARDQVRERVGRYSIDATAAAFEQAAADAARSGGPRG